MINETNLTDDVFTHDLALIPALNSITSHQMDTVADIARASGQEWAVQAGDDYDGYRFILLESVGHDDEQKNFFVAGTAQRLELFEGKEESLALIGTFTDMKALQARLAGLLDRQ
ncbi:MAG: hypothetical protein EOO77_39375 [Oxalobacteraceae bacterium]|nr:MAG: hypothetical protein EOO77_39375 [Oxalobacteraceae bacterium]